ALDGAPGVEAARLRHEADERVRLVRLALHVGAGDRHRAVVLRDEPGEDLEGRALAGAVGADVAEHLAGRDREGDVGEDLLPVEGLADTLELQHRGGHRAGSITTSTAMS